MREHPNRIPIHKCVEGHVYRLYSRNLEFGVFRKNEGKPNGPGFIGIRTKFGSAFLFEEYHWDTGAPFGTANPLEDLGPIPSGIEVASQINKREKATGRAVFFDHTPTDRPLIEGSSRMFPVGYCYADTREPIPKHRRVEWDDNEALFDFLREYEKDFGNEEKTSG